MNKPRGGELIDRNIDDAKKDAFRKEAEDFFKIDVNNEQISDIENVANGIFSLHYI